MLCCPAVEQLEPRRLLAAAAVNVNGTIGKDSILVVGSGDSYSVTVNGVKTDYAAVNVTNFIIGGLEGDDIIEIGAGVPGSYCDAGPGNDKIAGGTNADTLLGGAGKDRISAGGGNDRVNGAGGNDQILGGDGADRLYGGDGSDYISGGASGDRIYPGTGADTALGDGGNDNLFSIDATPDQLFGGSGTDTAHADNVDSRTSIEMVAIV
jgi:Ca2+-binding RTX toxin-like protein